MDATAAQSDTLAPSKAERQKKWEMPTRGHFNQCHLCQFDGRRDDEAQTACLACKGPPERPRGEGKVSLDACNGVLIGKPIAERPDAMPDDEKITIDAGTLSGILYAIAEMRRDTILVLHGLLRGFNLDGAAEYAGITRQYGHKYAMEAVRKIPQLAALLPMLSRKRIREREITARAQAMRAQANAPKQQAPEVMTYAEATNTLRVSRRTITRWVASGKIRSVCRLGRIVPYGVIADDVRKIAGQMQAGTGNANAMA